MTAAIAETLSIDDPTIAPGSGIRSEYVTIKLESQLLGIPVLTVQDVLGAHKILRIPLAPPAVAGALNLRGRIVTAIDTRVCLGLPPCADASEAMSVVIDYDGELYSLLVDDVGDVLAPPDDGYEANPANLAPPWRDICSGVYRLDSELLLLLDVQRLISLVDPEAA